MESSPFESLTPLAAVIGAAVLGSQAQAIGFPAAAVGDIAILLTVFTFDTGTRSSSQSLAFSAAAGFCLLTPLLVLANALVGSAPLSSLVTSPAWRMPVSWVVATAILFSVDRFRISSRENVSLAGGLAGFAPIMVTQPVTSGYKPAPIRVEPLPTPVPQPAPISVAEPAPAAIPITPPPDVTVIPPGREALIYLNLVGEGLNVLRTVRAENLGRDYYRIADLMPEGEQWEFTPGMVVRCRKKSLSNGKHMVAYEEAPRAL